MSSALAFLDSCHRLEVFEKFLFALRSKPLHAIKFRTETILTTDLTMEGDGKSGVLHPEYGEGGKIPRN